MTRFHSSREVSHVLPSGPIIPAKLLYESSQQSLSRLEALHLRCIVNASEFFDSLFDRPLDLVFLGYICPDGKALS